MSNKLLAVLVGGLAIVYAVGISSIINKDNAKSDARSPVEVYRRNILDRESVMVLQYRLPDSTRTNVLVDYALVDAVNSFLIDAEKYNIKLDRLKDLEFIAYDYILAGPRILGIRVGFDDKPDYIVINSHKFLDRFTSKVIVYHELTHLLKNDGEHSNEEGEPIVMSADFSSSTYYVLYNNWDEEVEKLFMNIRTHQANVK